MPIKWVPGNGLWQPDVERAALAALSAFPCLRSLEVSFKETFDLEPLWRLSALTSLTIRGDLPDECVADLVAGLLRSPKLCDVHLRLGGDSDGTLKELMPCAGKITSLVIHLNGNGLCLDGFDNLSRLEVEHWLQNPEERTLRLPFLSRLTQLSVTCNGSGDAIDVTGVEHCVSLRYLALRKDARVGNTSNLTQLTNLVYLQLDRNSGYEDWESFLNGCSPTLCSVRVKDEHQQKLLLRHARVSQISCFDATNLFDLSIWLTDLDLLQTLTCCELSLYSGQDVLREFSRHGIRLTNMVKLGIALGDARLNRDIVFLFPNLQELRLEWHAPKQITLPSPLPRMKCLFLGGKIVPNRSLLQAIASFTRLETLQLGSTTGSHLQSFLASDWSVLRKLSHLSRVYLNLSKEDIAQLRRLGLPAEYDCK